MKKNFMILFGIFIFSNICIIFLILFICDFYNNFSDSSPIVNSQFYKKYIEMLSSSDKINNYCVSLVSNENNKLNESSSKNIYSENRKTLGLNTCLRIISSSVKTQSLISASYYYKEKANFELKKQIYDTKEKFANDKDFLKFYINKVNLLETKSKNTINKEFPNPLDGRETPIYINLYESSFLEEQNIILQGLVYEYCLNNIKNKSCDDGLINN